MNTPLHLYRKGNRRLQAGAVVIEFALVFVIFFMIFYGIIAYGMVFAIKHSLMQAASEGTRAAVRDVIGGQEAREDLAKATASKVIAWMGTRAPTPTVTSAACASTPFICLKVTLTYDYAANPIIPPLPAFGVVLPDKLTAEATVQI